MRRRIATAKVKAKRFGRIDGYRRGSPPDAPALKAAASSSSSSSTSKKKTRKKPTTVPNGPIGRSVPTFFCSAVIGRRKRSHSRSANEGRPLGFGEAWRPTDPPIGGGVASQIRGPDCGQSQSPIRTHVPFPDNNINNNNNNNNNNNLAGFVSSMLRLSESPIASLFIGRPRGRSSGETWFLETFCAQWQFPMMECLVWRK